MQSDRQFDTIRCPDRWSINPAVRQTVQIFMPARESGILSGRQAAVQGIQIPCSQCRYSPTNTDSMADQPLSTDQKPWTSQQSHREGMDHLTIAPSYWRACVCVRVCDNKVRKNRQQLERLVGLTDYAFNCFFTLDPFPIHAFSSLFGGLFECSRLIILLKIRPTVP